MSTENEKIIESWQNYWDLPVPLSVELGRKRMSVREILALDKSSIIKLARSTGEGVEIRVDHQPLVYGEIIVIEDRTGVRVSEFSIEKK